jgi:hypothetical protein
MSGKKRLTIIMKKFIAISRYGITKGRPVASKRHYVISLLEILSFATSHYLINMQLAIVCNYFGHVCNYKFGIV